MDLKTKIFDQVSAARTGQKTVNEATESILDLLDVVGRSEQLCGCDAPFIRTSDKGGEYCGICEKDLD